MKIIPELEEMDEDERDELKKILVIDDEIFIVQLLEEVIKTQPNLFSKTTNQSKEGMEFANDYEFDLIIIDHLMPGILGSVVISKIRESDGPNKYTPFLVISGNPIEILKQHKNTKDIYFLDKPLQIKDVISNIQKILGT